MLADASSGIVISQSDRIISLIGVRDIVVIDTPDALLVTTTANAQRVKSVVDALKLQRSLRSALDLDLAADSAQVVAEGEGGVGCPRREVVGEAHLIAQARAGCG